MALFRKRIQEWSLARGTYSYRAELFSPYVRHLRRQSLGDEMCEWVLWASEKGHGEFLNFLRWLHNERSTFEDVAYSLVGNRIEELMIETNRYNNFMKPDVSGRAYSTWGDLFDRKECISSWFKLKKVSLLGWIKSDVFGNYFLIILRLSLMLKVD